MINASFDLSYLVLAIVSIPLAAFTVFSVLGLVITAVLVLSLGVGFLAGMVLFNVATIILFPITVVIVAALVATLLFAQITRPEVRNTSNR